MIHRTSASRRKRARNLGLAVVGLTIAGVAWLAMAWLMQRFQAARCPGSAFYWASNQIPTALQVVPLCFPAIGLGLLAASQLFAVPPTAPRRSLRPKSPGADRVREQAQMIKVTSMLLLIALPISFAGSLCQYCLEPDAILYQGSPWSGLRRYGWEEVSSVTATCRYSRGRYAGWSKQFILTLRDGSAIDLMTWPAAAVRAYPAIAQALRGQRLFIDTSGVVPGCPEPYSSMFASPP